MKTQPIHTEDWDYLIILDACRYDKFKKHYDKYLEGELQKVKSRGSATPEWLAKTFSGKRYNYQYITANPYINKQGFSLSEMVDKLDTDWYAKDKFTSVNEAWIDEWSDELETVHPNDLKNYAINSLSGGKAVIHFIQPHRPFISYEGDQNFTWHQRGQVNSEQQEETSLKYRFFQSTRPLWSPVFHSIPEKYKSMLRAFTGVGNDYRNFAHEIGEDRVQEMYESDLRLAFRNVEELVNELEGKVVVTADHGESFGENDEWGHPIGSDNPVLIEVPWLEVKNGG